jgi:hypothetical protein
MKIDSGFEDWSVLAAACGAIVPIAMRKDVVLRQIIVNSFVGVSTSAFTTPYVLQKLLHQSDLPTIYFVSFFIGLLGMRVCFMLLQWWDKNAEPFLTKIINKFLGQRDSNGNT